MIARMICSALVSMVMVLAVSAQAVSAEKGPIEGRLVQWHPLTFSFEGPAAAETDSSPNPFLDIRLQVTFTGPGDKRYDVPGFFDGDGKSGPKGNVWRVRFTPDAPGEWKFEANFRSGPGVAIALEPEAGQTLTLPNLSGTFQVAPRDPAAPGFAKWGRLGYVGKHYLKFADGPYWIRGGTDEPEDFLGYAGFDRTPPKHKYAAHLEDWRPGDPDWGDGQGKGIIGALNYLAAQHVNSIFFLTMNIGGDGKDVWPWCGQMNPKGSESNDNLHYDTNKLRQWEVVLSHAQQKGLFLHFVFNEAEAENKQELDNGELGPERKLYYREIIARFGHHLALQWNLCEEYNLNFDFGPERLRAFADYIQAVDPYDHPITVHSAGDPVEKLRFTYGDPRFSMTSIQLNQKPIHEVTEAIFRATADAGRPLPVSLDEFTLDRGQRASHLPVDEAEGLRREKLWPTYLSGGNIEFILQDLLRTDSFKTPERAKLWLYMGHARKFMEENLPFWEMEPADELSQNGATIPLGIGKGKTTPLGPQVFAKRGDVYAMYLPQGSPSGTLDLSDFKGKGELRWFNPRSGEFEGSPQTIEGGKQRELGAPPADPQADWVVLIRRDGKQPPAPIRTSGFNSGISHWRRIRDDKRFIQPTENQASYAPTQVEDIVANILLFQRANGGWPKDYDMLAVLNDEQKRAVRATHNENDTSFDNGNIHSQVEYLARAYTATGNIEWRDACLRGFDFMLAAQLPCGGFPQRYPDPKGFSAHVTFNDGVMMGIMEVLRDAASGAAPWNWLDAARREKAGQAVERGVECIVKCQIRVDGQLTGWCQQHDAQSFEAASARTFELASICPQETASIVHFLMQREHPSAAEVAAIEAAVNWLERVQLKGVAEKRVPAPEEEFLRHRANFDVVIVPDASAPPLWARHYEIGTNRPIFAGRDGVKRYALSEIERERRTGTAWYGRWPQSIVQKEFAAWKVKHPSH